MALALGKTPYIMSSVALGVISDGINDLCFPEVTLAISRTPDFEIAKVAPFLKKLSGIKGQVSQLNQVFQWFSLPYVEPILISLGGSEAVS